jgi:hypothetical protein
LDPRVEHEAHARESKVRLKEYRDNPTVGSPWSEVRERIISEP